MEIDKHQNLWAVVEVVSGIPVTAEVYLNRNDAEEREKIFRDNINLENDETGIFEVSIK